jgi:hypothetical protein
MRRVAQTLKSRNHASFPASIDLSERATVSSGPVFHPQRTKDEKQEKSISIPQRVVTGSVSFCCWNPLLTQGPESLKGLARKRVSNGRPDRRFERVRDR